MRETVRDQPAWPAGFPGERPRRARLLRPAHARPVHRRDRPGLRGEGARPAPTSATGGDRRLHRPVRAAARSRPEPLLGEPLLDDDVRQAADPVAGPAPPARRRLPPGAHPVGGRRGEGRRRRARVPGAAAHAGTPPPSTRSSTCSSTSSGTSATTPPSCPRQAHRGRVPRAPRRAHLGGARARPGLPRLRLSEILDADGAVPELEALQRWAMVLHNQYPWDRSRTQLRRSGESATTTGWSRSTRTTATWWRSSTACRRGAAEPAAVRGGPAGHHRRAAGAALPAGPVREAFRVQPRLESLAVARGEHRLRQRRRRAQRELLLVADER